MIVLAMFLKLLEMVLGLYFWIVIISALLSWVNPDPYNRIVVALRKLTEPAFYKVRKYLPFTYTSGLDLSPVVVLLAVELARYLVRYTQLSYGLIMPF